MSDAQERAMHRDPNSPVNAPEWDGLWDCPDCGDHTGNMVNADEPLTDCLDHTEDGDLRAKYRKDMADLKAEYKKWFEWKDARIHELETRLADMTRLVELGLKLDELRREET